MKRRLPFVFFVKEKKDVSPPSLASEEREKTPRRDPPSRARAFGNLIKRKRQNKESENASANRQMQSNRRAGTQRPGLRHAHSPVLATLPSLPLLAATTISCRASAVAFGAPVALCVVWQVGGLEASVGGDGAYGAFVTPCVLLVWVGVDSGDDGVDAACCAGGAWWLLVHFVGERVADGGCFGAVAVAFEDLLGGDLGVVGPQAGVVEDEGEIFGDLRRVC